MKTLYLHIGIPKTATTSIQKFCVKNRDLLSQKGFYYPESFHIYKNIVPDRNAHFLFGTIKNEEGKRRYKYEGKIRREGLAHIVKLFEEHDNIILSDESIWWATSFYRKDLWDMLKEEGENHNYCIKIIVYLRRQDEFLLSRYNQLVKAMNSHSEPFEEYYDTCMTQRRKILEYCEKIDEIAEVLGKENIIVKRFDRDFFYKGDVIADFLHIFGLELTDEYAPLDDDLNVGIGLNSGEIKRKINTLGKFEDEENKFVVKLLKECEDKLPKCTEKYLSSEETREMLSQFEEGNKRIAEEYIGDGKPLFKDVTDGTQKWTRDNDVVADETVMFLYSLCRALHTENKVLQDKDKENRKNIASLSKRLSALEKEVKKNEKRIRDLKDALRHPFKAIFRKFKK
ncbi:MAG: hypothetical protein ACI4HM_00390 [Ruminococcus sp.]